MQIKQIADENKANKIREAVRKNGGYCPCALEKTDRTRCMCADFVEQKEDGPCRCGLYIKTSD